MKSLSRPQLAALALDALEDGDTRHLALKYGVDRSTIYRYLRLLIAKRVLKKGFGECVYAKDEGWKTWFDGIDSGRWDAPHWQDSQRHQLVGSTHLPIPDKPPSPALAGDFRFENGRQLFELMAPPPVDLLRFLRPMSRDKAGRIRSWFGEVHYPHGTVQWHIGVDRSTAQFELKRQWFSDQDIAEDPAKVDAFLDKVFAWWPREVEKDYGVRLTLRGVPVKDPRARGRPGTLSTGHLEKSFRGVETVGKVAMSETSRTDDSPPGPSVDTVSLGEEARNLARAAMSGGFETLHQDIAALAGKVDDLGSAVHELVKVLKGEVTPPQGPAPQGGGENPPGYA